MAVFVWCCQPPLLFPGLLLWLIHSVFTDTNRLLCNVSPKRKCKGRIRKGSVWISTSEGKGRVVVFGVQRGLWWWDDVGGDHKHENTISPCPLVQPLCMLIIATGRWLNTDQHTQMQSGHKRIPATCLTLLCPLFYLWPCIGMCWAQPQQENCDEDRMKDQYSTSISGVSIILGESGLSFFLVLFAAK